MPWCMWYEMGGVGSESVKLKASFLRGRPLLDAAFGFTAEDAAVLLVKDGVVFAMRSRRQFSRYLIE